MKIQFRNIVMISVIGFIISKGLLSCDNDNEITVSPLKDGFYSGSFTYDSLVLWESFLIDNNNFCELASGGVLYQKFPEYCLTEGSYKVVDDKVYFENVQVVQPPNGSLDNYNENYLLMGSYVVENCSDSSITFWRTVDNKKQTYDLELYYENE